MELRHLRYFVAVAEALSFSRAATRLRLAQPSLSAQIRSLEDDLGLQLLERDRNRVALTDAGAVFLKEARQVLARADKAVARAREAAEGKTGELRVASMGPLTFNFLPACLTRLHAELPAAKVNITEMSASDQLTQVTSGRVHLGFVPAPFPSLGAGKKLAAQLILKSPLAIVMSTGHPLASQKSIRLNALEDETFVPITMFGTDAQRIWSQEVCRKSGFLPRFGPAASSPDNLVTLVAAGSGVALIPKIAERMSSPGCITVPVADRGLRYELYALYDDRFPSVLRDRFLAIVTDEAVKVQAILESNGSVTGSH
jgi:LysR family hca operon transcriptional activator